MAKQQPKPSHREVPKQKSKTKPAPTGTSFLKFLLDKEQRIDWAIIGGLLIAILIFLKIYYPYPMTETDSGNYILSAATGKINGYRPYGYSGFMGFFHGISPDIKFLVTWQWFFTFISVTFFLFTVKFIFRSLPRVAFYILCLICILNPSVIFMDSYIMSDSLFVSLTLLFLTTFVWIVYNGSWTAIATNLILLWWCMDVRYIGLFYPMFSAAAIIWALWKRFKWLSLAAGLLPLLMLYFYRSNATDKMKEEFGVETFSAFGGWQKANNGVAVIPYINKDTSGITDPQIRYIHQLVLQCPDSFYNTDCIIATNFMWWNNYPGKIYLSHFIQAARQSDPGYDYVRAWVNVAPQLEAYGDFLQSRYRTEYFKHYIIPNFKNVFKVFKIADVEDSISYASSKGFFTSDREWYYYKTHYFRNLTSIRQVCDSLAWIVLILSAIAGAVTFKKIDWTLNQKLIVVALVLFIGAFSGASTIAAPINNFRYMMPVFYAQILAPILILSGIAAAVRKKTE